MIQTESLSRQDLVKDEGMDIYIKKDKLTAGAIDRGRLPAFAYLKKDEEPSDCSVMTNGMCIVVMVTNLKLYMFQNKL